MAEKSVTPADRNAKNVYWQISAKRKILKNEFIQTKIPTDKKIADMDILVSGDIDETVIQTAFPF
jgi:hypothetical protein